jgi:hypothetical protein
VHRVSPSVHFDNPTGVQRSHRTLVLNLMRLALGFDAVDLLDMVGHHVVWFHKRRDVHVSDRGTLYFRYLAESCSMGGGGDVFRVEECEVHAGFYLFDEARHFSIVLQLDDHLHTYTGM